MEAQNSLGQRSVMTLSSKTLDKTLITPTDTIMELDAASAKPRGIPTVSAHSSKNFQNFPIH